MNFYRGLLIAFALSVAIWLLIIEIVRALWRTAP